MGLLRRFWSLSGPDRRLVIEAAMDVVATRFGLLIFGYRGLTTLVSRISQATGTRPGELEPAERVAAMLNATARHLPLQATCLERSLALWMMLKRRGCDAELRIGARKSGGHFEAHAWIEHGGMVLNDASAEYLSFSNFENPLPARCVEAR